MSQDPFDPLPRIDALTKNARTTWFTLLGVILFVGVTLMGVEHIDFYGVDRNTQLPLVNVSVPTDLFFYAAPVLTAAVYVYFHLYLIRLFDELGAANAKVQGKPLGQIVTPWLVTDAALWLRNWRRDDRSAKKRPFEMPSAVFNILLAWGAGLFVLAFAWERSLPARTFAMSGIAALSLWCAVVMGVTSLAAMIDRLTARDDSKSHLPVIFIGIVTLAMLADTTYRKTQGDLKYLAPISLVGEEIVKRPTGWLPYSVAHKDYKDSWCKTKTSKETCDLYGDLEFESDWTARRTIAIQDLPKPKWGEVGSSRSLSLDAADISQAFLAGAQMSLVSLNMANLNGSDLEHANLLGSSMKNASMINANLEAGVFSGADLERAVLIGSNAVNTDFIEAQMTRANLSGADFSRSNLFNARLTNANLFRTDLTGASLEQADLRGANLSGAFLKGADLKRSNMDQAILSGASLVGSDLSQSSMIGSAALPVYVNNAKLAGAVNDGGAIRYANFENIDWDENTDFTNTLVDISTVSMPSGFIKQMGNPCQWISGQITDGEFLSLWRWWLEKRTPVIPIHLRSVEVNDALVDRLGLANCEPS